MTTLTESIAAAPDSPPALLVAILGSTSPDNKADQHLRAALAGNPSLPTVHVEQIARTARGQDVRRALMANPATTLEQARRWLSEWTNVPLAVWRTAVSCIEDPHGHLASMALERHQGTWLYSEILTSTTTGEAARIAAAVKLASLRKVNKTERDRIMAVAIRNADLAPTLRDATGDTALREAMAKLADAQDDAFLRNAPASDRGDDVQAWLAMAPDETTALTALAGCTRSAVWRAAARTCRPGWDRMSAQIMAFARAENQRSATNAAAIAKAVLANPGTRRVDRVEAARMAAAAGRGMTDDMRKVVHRTTTTLADRNALVGQCRDTRVMAWQLGDGANLDPAVKARAARFICESRWANPWLRDSVLALLLLDPDIADTTRRSLLDASSPEALRVLDTDGGHDLVLSLPWHDTIGAIMDALARRYAGVLSWPEICAARALALGSVYRAAAAAGPGLGPLADVPVHALHQAHAPAHIGGIALRVVEHATATAGRTVPDSVVLSVLDAIGAGFEGTLGELATVVGASLNAA